MFLEGIAGRIGLRDQLLLAVAAGKMRRISVYTFYFYLCKSNVGSHWRIRLAKPSRCRMRLIILWNGSV
jgi:hypothetical protein